MSIWLLSSKLLHHPWCILCLVERTSQKQFRPLSEEISKLKCYSINNFNLPLQTHPKVPRCVDGSNTKISISNSFGTLFIPRVASPKKEQLQSRLNFQWRVFGCVSVFSNTYKLKTNYRGIYTGAQNYIYCSLLLNELARCRTKAEICGAN